jgi:hypothetical protein
VGAHELVEAGRQHVATGRIREAMACFKRAADDPERGAEALSLLAAAYLLPGSLAPELALAHAHRAASHPAAGGEHLARCAAVALSAGDPSLAEELAGRAGRAGGGEALAIRATAMRRGRLRAPALPDVLVRATAAPLFLACLTAATVLAMARPERLAGLAALGFLALGLGMAVLARRG